MTEQETLQAKVIALQIAQGINPRELIPQARAIFRWLTEDDTKNDPKVVAATPNPVGASTVE